MRSQAIPVVLVGANPVSATEPAPQADPECKRPNSILITDHA